MQALIAEKDRRLTENRLAYYKPYPKQAEFHAAGLKSRERLLMAGNQLGKTLAGGMECAYHLTGRYPPDWRGRKFDRPVIGWVCGRSDEDIRDGMQRILLGRAGALGTGSIPKDAITDLVPARGTSGLFDVVRMQHISGGISNYAIRSYKSGREAFQSETLDFVCFDEEPPADIYTEGLTRTNIGGGLTWLTFTPLLGVSEVVRRFLLEKSPDRHITNMTIDDVGHFSQKEKEQITASYPSHEREARTKGIPILGSGRIFPIPEEIIMCEQRDFPEHWPRIGGMDFGWDHPFAAVEIVWDRDEDTVYLSRCYRLSQATPVVHAGALRSWGNLPWSWPRDGRRETLEGAGQALAKQYAEQGLDMLHDHAQFEDGGVSVEAGILDMLTMMEAGRLKVFRHHNDWFEEYRLYHRKNGKVVKQNDDLLSATRYGLMMLRFARPVKAIKLLSPFRMRYRTGSDSWMGT